MKKSKRLNSPIMRKMQAARDAKLREKLFDFWKNNRIDQYFTLTGSELQKKFQEWIAEQKTSEDRGEKWLQYYYGMQLIHCFTGDKEGIKGLESVANPDEGEDLYDVLYPIFSSNI